MKKTKQMFMLSFGSADLAASRGGFGDEGSLPEPAEDVAQAWGPNP